MIAVLFAAAVVLGVACSVALAGLTYWRLEGVDLRSLERHERARRVLARLTEDVE